MKNVRYLMCFLFLVVSVASIFVFQKMRNGSNPSPEELDDEMSFMPFSYSLPSGWKSERTFIEENPIQGGGAMNVLHISSSYPDPQFPGFFDPTLSLFWFSFDPNVSIEKIVPLLHPSGEKEFQTSSLAGQDAVHILSMKDFRKTIDGEPTAYRVDEYLIRLRDSEVLRIQIFYGTKESFDRGYSEVQSILNSIELE